MSLCRFLVYPKNHDPISGSDSLDEDIIDREVLVRQKASLEANLCSRQKKLAIDRRVVQQLMRIEQTTGKLSEAHLRRVELTRILPDPLSLAQPTKSITIEEVF